MGHYLYDGKIKSIGEIQTFASNFKKREFVVIEEVEQYPQEIKFEFVGEQVEVMNNFKVGESVTVAFILRGNEYQGKHFVNLKAIGIGERLADNDELRQEKPSGKIKTRPVITKTETSDGDLPF
jgi:hypothetical protein